MCFSCTGQVVYGLVMMVTFALTLMAILSPAWKQFMVSDEVRENYSMPEQSGLFPYLCVANSRNGTLPKINYCDQWWKEIQDAEKAVILAMCLALGVELVAGVWTFVSFCACFCRTHIMHPLPVFALFAALFLCVAIGLFGSSYKNNIKAISLDDDVLKRTLQTSTVGYGFHLTCGALTGAVIDIVVGSLTVMFSKALL